MVLCVREGVGSTGTVRAVEMSNMARGGYDPRLRCAYVRPSCGTEYPGGGYDPRLCTACVVTLVTGCTSPPGGSLRVPNGISNAVYPVQGDLDLMHLGALLQAYNLQGRRVGFHAWAALPCLSAAFTVQSACPRHWDV